MLVRPAEETFQKGLAALAHGRRIEALALFEAAIELDRKFSSEKIEARYLSYFGLCLAMDKRRAHEGVKFCREALAAEFFNPDLYLNLARALLASERRKEAFAVLQQGLGWERRHPGIVKELRAMGRRRRPPIPFLARSNPLNVLLGRISYQRAAVPAPR
jgi:tetratricopeptide (TPR) repeat protein